MENRIVATLSVADRDKVLDSIAQIRTLLPFLIDLTPEERQALPKMGDKSRAFVSQALQLAEHGEAYTRCARSLSIGKTQQTKRSPRRIPRCSRSKIRPKIERNTADRIN